jgi:hypothetical protein
MRTVNVVMINVLGQHRSQLPASQDQHPVKQLPPNGAHPPLRIGIRLRLRTGVRGPFDRLGSKYRIERGGELRVPITDQKPEPADLPRKLHEQIAACCVTHSPDGWAVTPRTWTRREATSIINSTYRRLSNTVSTVKKSTASTPLAWARKNWRHETADRLGAGATPARRRMVHTVLAPIP